MHYCSDGSLVGFWEKRRKKGGRVLFQKQSLIDMKQAANSRCERKMQKKDQRKDGGKDEAWKKVCVYYHETDNQAFLKL